MGASPLAVAKSIYYLSYKFCFMNFVFLRGILELNYSHSCLWVQAIDHTMTLKTTRSPACLIKQYKFYSQSDLGTFNFLHCLTRIFSFGIKNIIRYYSIIRLQSMFHYDLNIQLNKCLKPNLRRLRSNTK